MISQRRKFGGMEPRHMVDYLLSGESDGQPRVLEYSEVFREMMNVNEFVKLLQEVCPGLKFSTPFHHTVNWK